jgi:hypothetical protein
LFLVVCAIVLIALGSSGKLDGTGHHADADAVSASDSPDGETTPAAPKPAMQPIALVNPVSVPALQPIVLVNPAALPHVAQTSPSPTTRLMLLPDEHGKEVLYRPGYLTVSMLGLLLSEGLSARVLATKNMHVSYANGLFSTERFHARPDFGATFVDTRPENPGGWIYVSNSEMNETSAGGVGALTFNAEGNVIDYKMVLTNTTMNCGGGRTPWHTWVSCEEVDSMGSIYQVDPSGARQAQTMTLGRGHGRFESFTFDVRDMKTPRFYASEDRKRGAVRRFTPDVVDWETDPWSMLHGDGQLDFLLMNRTSDNGGTFAWTTDESAARNSAAAFYPECEGIDVDDGIMYLISKRIKTLFILDLDAGAYQHFPTAHGIFDGQPDQVSHILCSGEADILYFTEEGGENAGIHGRNALGQFFTILEGPGYQDETTGLSFSPDGLHLYVAYQADGLLFDVTRVDGLPFQGKSLNVKYHNGDVGGV